MSAFIKYSGHKSGFTIVELLVVIVVIGILAGLTIVSFTGISQKAVVATLQSDLKSAANILEIDRINSSSETYPISEAAANNGNGLPKSEGTIYSYNVSSDYKTYLLSATASGVATPSYVSSVGGTVQQGDPYAFPSGLDVNLVSYWDLDETSGVRYDSRGTNNLADNNTVTYASGKVGNASQHVKANNEYLSITDASQSGLDLATLSANMWVNVTDNTQIMSFFAKWNHAVNNQYRFEYDTGNLTFTTASTCGSYNYTGSNHSWTPVNGRWYMLSVTYDGTTSKTYIDGALVRTATLSRAIQNCAGTFMIGGQQSSSAWAAAALIDEFGIWSRVLSDSDIANLYNNGFGLRY